MIRQREIIKALLLTPTWITPLPLAVERGGGNRWGRVGFVVYLNIFCAKKLFLGIKNSTSIPVQTQKNAFLLNFTTNFALFLTFFNFLVQKT